MSFREEVSYSSKYYDEEFEYRHVHITKEIYDRMPKDRLMTEDEWRKAGIQQSVGWVHYMVHAPEKHVVLFRRPRTDLPPPKAGANMKNGGAGDAPMAC